MCHCHTLGHGNAAYLLICCVLCVTSSSESFIPLTEGKERHHSAQQFLSDPATWRHKLELTLSHANTERLPLLQVFQPLLSCLSLWGHCIGVPRQHCLCWYQSHEHAQAVHCSISGDRLCHLVVHCSLFTASFTGRTEIRKHLLHGSTGTLQLFPKEQPLGQPYLIPRYNHNSKCVIHVESKANSAWLILHEELAQDIRTSSTVLILNKKTTK